MFQVMILSMRVYVEFVNNKVTPNKILLLDA